MTKSGLLSAALITAAMFATPALARTHHVTRHYTDNAEVSASPVGYSNGPVCIPAPRVGAFATAPWTDGNVPCEPQAF